MINLLKNCPLFFEINLDDLNNLLPCLSARKKIYQKGEYIFSEGEIITDIGIILHGNVQIVKDDYWGNRSIISLLSTGELFGESFASSSNRVSKVNAIAVEKCEVLIIDFVKIINTCNVFCIFHSQLIKNMIRILANKNIMLTEKMELITKRTIRDRVFSYFSAIAKQNGNQFTIPYNRQELADYLSIDRSALSRELGLMKEEGLLDYHKNHFLLKK